MSQSMTQVQEAKQEVMTIPQVANYLQISQRTVLRYLVDNKLPGKLIGTKWRCKRSEIDKLLS